ncbi:MAG: 5-(carboxyamino)imidazole ribonucleotide synthase [Gammaproteobacteria bacterium]|jgi:5-(carboxyamino)imidazole ribonucleotide synthase
MNRNSSQTRPQRVGIIGAGQLGRMLALAGYPFGLRFVFVDKSEDAPGGQVGDILLGEFSDAGRIRDLADVVDVMTFDVENVPVEAVMPIVDRVPFYPPVAALEGSQDRLTEKDLFGEHGIPTARYRAVSSREELDDAIADIGLPAVLKTRRMGYDGKGQRVLKDESDVDPAWDDLGAVPLILEGFVPFEREVSIIAVRNVSGETAFYPLSENHHEEGILRHSIAPYANPELEQQARSHASALLDSLNYVGVLTIEFFVADGRLLANEMAPRVHNSGHWTIEGAVTSQFENHVRAILDLPLGDTRPRGHAAMVNFLGRMPELDDVLRIPGVHYHSYGKEPRPARKLGHATITADNHASLLERLEAVLALARPA